MIQRYRRIINSNSPDTDNPLTVCIKYSKRTGFKMKVNAS